MCACFDTELVFTDTSDNERDTFQEYQRFLPPVSELV